jgi:hypothetical protein
MAATWLGWPYFEGALADAPASARPDANSAAARMANAPVMGVRRLYIAPSIWSETTQTEQVLTFPSSTTLSAVSLSLAIKVILFLKRRKNQPSRARKMRNKERR